MGFNAILIPVDFTVNTRVAIATGSKLIYRSSTPKQKQKTDGSINIFQTNFR